MDFKVSVFKHAKGALVMRHQVWGIVPLPKLLQLATQLGKHYVQGKGTQILKLGRHKLHPGCATFQPCKLRQVK